MFFKDFFHAIGSHQKALQLFRELGLWKYLFVPILIGLVLGVIIIVTAYQLAGSIGDYVAGFWPFSWGEGFIDGMSTIISGALVLLLGIMIFKHAVMAFAAPFMTPVSEKIEMHLSGKTLDKTDTVKEYTAALIRGIRINVRNLLLEILITIPLLIVSFIPLLNIVSSILIFYVQAYYAGFGNMDYTLERYRDYSGSIKFVRKYKGIAAGNGTVFILLLLIPVVGICLALPLSTAAATVNTLEKLKNEKE